MKNKIISIIFIILFITSCHKSRDITGGGGVIMAVITEEAIAEILDLQKKILNSLKQIPTMLKNF